MISIWLYSQTFFEGQPNITFVIQSSFTSNPYCCLVGITKSFQICQKYMLPSICSPSSFHYAVPPFLEIVFTIIISIPLNRFKSPNYAIPPFPEIVFNYYYHKYLTGQVQFKSPNNSFWQKKPYALGFNFHTTTLDCSC